MATLQNPAPAAPEITTLLGKGTTFEGKLTFEGVVRLDGRFTGEISSTSTLVVGEGAEVRARIDIGTLIVEGHIEGNVRAIRLVELHAPAMVRGDIETPQLLIGKGVIFEGQCKMEDLTTGRTAEATAAANGRSLAAPRDGGKAEAGPPAPHGRPGAAPK